ncbi:MAG TPA: NUDIX hydrolase [Caulobacteraceae bacterium]|jgi:8-oxo-dGTP pyrophosphatase MutT (NUDIX family)|nr:NUDIX hydrolase [Caulobacteraceae bacterium]
MKPTKLVGIQYAALPFRIRDRQVEVMLITSRGTQRWVIPKGWPMNGKRPQDAAETEAAEEAGVVGEIEERPLGSYHYQKGLKDDRSMDVQVIVFPLRVAFQAEDWKERHERRAEWFRYQRAAALVAEPALRHLIQDFGADRTPTLLAQSLRSYRAWRAMARG